MPLDQIFSAAFQRSYKSSALTPLLWLTSVVALPSLYFAAQSEGIWRIAFFLLAVGLVVSVLAAYAYLVHRDPRLVQSESFQIEARKLDIVESKGTPPVDARSIEVVPEPRALPQGETNPESSGSST